MASKTSRLTARPHFCFPVHILARMIPVILVVLLGALAWAPAPSLSAATLPPGFADFPVATGLASPTAMAIAPDGRIFVCEQEGRMRVIKNGALLPTPFVSISVDPNGERGLLGVAFDPDFAANQFVYVYYTTSTAPIHNRISRFTASGDVAVPGSEVVILEIDNVINDTVAHNGGALHFGPDGKLYIAVGDHNRPDNSQELNTLKGKFLRINPNGTIPPDNPFYNTASGNYRAIWAFGLRNPFTFAIQPGTGRVFINDVGFGSYEEINDGIAGANYGWPTCEGACSPPNSAFRDPIYAYPTTIANCAITGGAFYNPVTVRFPSTYFGKYFFADLCGGWIKLLDPATNAVSDFATISTSAVMVDLDVSTEGDLYYLQRGGGGQVRRIAYTATQSPVIVQHPANLIVTAGQAATFSVSASGAPPLSYQWRRDGGSVAGATSATYTIASTTLADDGARFRCVVGNAFGTATSNEATLSITANQPPAATISTPVAGTLYRGGQTISYAGTGTDPETGNLPASAFTWQVDFHHDTHTHPHVPPTRGAASGSFVIPRTGEIAVNVWYRIHLTVTDPAGLSHSVYRDIFPQISTITLQTSPPGLQLTLDGAPTATPASLQSVVGISRTLGVVSPQNVGGTNYVFGSWSDGGAATHTISTPSANTTYTATYAACSYTISPTTQTIAPAGGSGTVSVTAAAGCSWTAVNNDAWITVTAGSSGSGNGSVSYSVSANTGAARTGTLAVAGLT
ncbi:MAG: PQQ-dependent sugar dehydrogenase, partial [Blastocatellia bacterium]